MLLLLLFILSTAYTRPTEMGFVEKHPCGVCHRTVGKNNHSVFCDSCELWVHRKCGLLTVKAYKNLCKMDHFDWTCPTCLAATLYGDSTTTTQTTSQSSDEEDPPSPQNKPNMNQIKVMTVNCNSLVSTSKRAQLLEIIDTHCPGIICGCETKLDSNHGDNEVFPTEHFEIFRRDNKQGEGVCS